jgi:hypothetical protein
MGGPVKKDEITHLNVWFGLNGLGSSQKRPKQFHPPLVHWLVPVHLGQ